jgi:drug/metabolite transporter (DMT)-like permease
MFTPGFDLLSDHKMKSRIWLALIVVYIAWGSTYLAIRFAVESIPPFLMAGTRFLIAGSLVYIWRRLAGDPSPTRLQWRSSVIIGLLLLLGGNGGLTWAEQYLPSGFAALMVATIPLWMVLVDALWPGGKLPNWQTILGVLLGLAGIVILVRPAAVTSSHSRFELLGVIALLLASLSWAVGSIYSRKADLPKSAFLGTGMEMLAGSAGLFLVGTLSGEWNRLDLSAITSRSLAGLGYLIVVGSLMGYAAYTWLLRAAPISLVSTYAYVNPVIAVILGSILAQEKLTPTILFSTLVILFSVVVINQGRTITGKPAPKRLAVPTNVSDD